jgi:hypothetical protein
MRFVVLLGVLALAAACSSSSPAGGGGGDSGGGGNDGASPGSDGGDASSGEAGGATGAAAFVGTWARSGTTTLSCPGSNPQMGMLSGNLVITIGTAAGTIVGTQPNGCMTTYSVTGNVASLTATDVCTSTGPAGGTETLTNTMHTFTLASDGKTFAEASAGMLSVGDAGAPCPYSTMGTFTKQ